MNHPSISMIHQKSTDDFDHFKSKNNSWINTKQDQS